MKAVRSGEKILASGNVLHWECFTCNGSPDDPTPRGSFRGRVMPAGPTTQDIQEIENFFRAMLPENAEEAHTGVVVGNQRSNALIARFLGQPSEN